MLSTSLLMKRTNSNLTNRKFIPFMRLINMVCVIPHRIDSEHNVKVVKMIQDEVGDTFTSAEVRSRFIND